MNFIKRLICQVSYGLTNGIINILDSDPDSGCERLCCKIGENSFYFSNSDMTAMAYAERYGTDCIVLEIASVLFGWERFGLDISERNYYISCLEETCSTKAIAQKIENLIMGNSQMATKLPTISFHNMNFILVQVEDLPHVVNIYRADQFGCLDPSTRLISINLDIPDAKEFLSEELEWLYTDVLEKMPEVTAMDGVLCYLKDVSYFRSSSGYSVVTIGKAIGYEDLYYANCGQIQYEYRQLPSADQVLKKIKGAVEGKYKSTLNAEMKIKNAMAPKPQVDADCLEFYLGQEDSLENLFPFEPGQECEIYKGDWDNFDDSSIIYIADVPVDHTKPGLNKEEIKDVLENVYTKHDFLAEANGNELIAKRLFLFVDWQSPNLRDMLDCYSDEEWSTEFGVDIGDYK